MRTCTNIVAALATIVLMGSLVAWIGFSNWRSAAQPKFPRMMVHQINNSRTHHLASLQNLTLSEQSQEYQENGVDTNKPLDNSMTTSEPRQVHQDSDMGTDKPPGQSLEDGKLSEQSQEYQENGMDTNKTLDNSMMPSEQSPVHQDSDMGTNKPPERSLENGKNTSKALNGYLSEQSQEYILNTNNTFQMNTVKEMMKHAWNNYKLYAWGKNELKPLSKRPHLSGFFGNGDLGVTIVDGLDTLYLMGMKEEFREGRDWVKDHLHISEFDSDLSVFETTIRFIGGLLSCYALTGDSVFKDKAAEVADALLPAFNSPTGLPYALINPSTKATRQYHWAGPNSILSEVGTLHLEFSYLSDVTGNPVYKQKVDAIRDVLFNAEKPGDLYPNYINVRTGQWGQDHISLGALGDSFYEYLLKAWLMSGQKDQQARIMFDTTMQAALDKMLRTSPSGLAYLAELKYGRIFEEKMDHMSCFAGGMFALASTTLENSMSARYMEVAENLTNTCHESYIRSDTKLGPEAFRFSGAAEARAGVSSIEKVYLLRPETVESYFILWRLTRKQQYRDWGWEVVEALEKHCRVDGGYSGLLNVYHAQPQRDDVQQSFFLAETLKYLYLLFADDSLLSLEDWVLNTEAHPLPVKGKNPLYRAAPSTLLLHNDTNQL